MSGVRTGAVHERGRVAGVMDGTASDPHCGTLAYRFHWNMASAIGGKSPGGYEGGGGEWRDWLLEVLNDDIGR